MHVPRTGPSPTRLGAAFFTLTLALSACSGAPAAPSGATTPATTVPATTVATPATTAAAIATSAATMAPSAAPMSRNRIAFGVRGANGAHIFSVEPDGTDLRQLTSGAGNHLCAAYLADHSRIGYCGDSSGAFEIWTMAPDGSDQQQLTHLNGRALFPDFSRDGKLVAFGGVEGTDAHTEIYVVDAATGEHAVALTSCEGKADGCSNDYPAWSPDDKHIVYIHTDDFDANERAVNGQVWVMDADGSNAHALTSGDEIKDQVPDWSPDGKQIAYASNEGPNEGVWLMQADGSKQHQLSGCKAGEPSPCAAGADFGPVWSPDGTKIAFLRSFLEVGREDRPLYLMNPDGSDQHRLMEGTILQAVPAWQ